MRTTGKFLAATVIAVSAPWMAGPAAAAPISENLVMKSAAPDNIESVRYRRHRGWVGPAAGFAAGAVIGGALVGSRYYYDDGYYGYGPGYYSYGYAPAARYRTYRAPPYRGYNERGYAFCTRADESVDSAYPGWACPDDR